MNGSLTFYYGVVSSAKTALLLLAVHQYREQEKNVVLLKPALDNRYGADVIKSRAGLSAKADVLVSVDTDLVDIAQKHPEADYFVVDEAQFLEPKHIVQLAEIARTMKVPVICYGLRTDFRGQLFPGSKTLLELAETIKEIQTTCHFCNSKAVLNLKHVNGVATLNGPIIELGCEEKYYPVCYSCYKAELGRGWNM